LDPRIFALDVVLRAIRSILPHAGLKDLARWSDQPLDTFLDPNKVVDFLEEVAKDAEQELSEIGDLTDPSTSQSFRKSFSASLEYHLARGSLERLTPHRIIDILEPHFAQRIRARTISTVMEKAGASLRTNPESQPLKPPESPTTTPPGEFTRVFGPAGDSARVEGEDRPPRKPLEPPTPARPEGYSGIIISTGKSVTTASLVRVFYATDRMQLPWKRTLHYDKRRSLFGKLHYGECEISVPKVHKLGKLETPSIFKLELRPNPEKHVVLQKIRSLEESVFLERVAASVAASMAKEAFIFIHGYKVSFEDAGRRTGQIAFDLHFVGAPIFYSWPSNGTLADYLKDETNITWSTPHFQRFLSLLSQHSGAKRIHIIAHSMGNRAVCDALKALSYDPNSNLKFNHLVLAAPDIDADTFRELAATLQRLSGRITLYESSKDKAIQASKKIHGSPRAGEPLLIIPGLDTIDASAIDTDFLGHSYFSDNWPLLSDIHSILFKDVPPAERFGLTERQHPDGKYYAFRP